ncbi:hypothetical protein [Streptosporangium sp. NPDC000396]|uniref:hypothetical protein n=1 Tax=Streptosporangium sp. NPDC000396 TaxID=3366185 RepID=UPI0036813DCA
MPDTPDLRVTFRDHYTPRVTAGVYTVQVRHELWKENGERIDQPALPESSQSFEVRPVRFVLDPGSVHAFYPPADSAGAYDTVLPHITLTRAVLPWERELVGTRAREHAPWLALLMFRQGELPDDEKASGESVIRTVAELITPAEGGVIGPALSGPSLTPEVLSSKCRTIDVPAEVFHAIAPYEEEMYYLAHVRDVTKATMRQDGEDLVEGRYAVITGNRFPRDPGYYAVHLVSLEGYERYVDPNPPTGHRALRLCSLRSWSFHNDPDNSLDIPGMLKNLAAPGHADPENLALRINLPATAGAHAVQDEAEAYARRRLELGYAPVPFRTLSGELTYAWYRGPFTPVTAPRVPEQATSTGHTTADHALIYEEAHGLFDVSYATAWTLGRTLGLADPDYAAEMTRARRELGNRAAVVRKLAADPARAQADPDEGRSLRALRELAGIADGRALADALAAPLAEQSPAAAPKRRNARIGMQELLTDERTVSLLRTTAERNTGSMPEWLDRLMLFKGVPFAYLVPDPRMLPPESLRMFRIDPAWRDAVVAGACDVGLHISQDLALDPQIRGAVARRRSTAPPAAGLLIYSELVRALPDLVVTAFAGTTPVAELRRDLLAPDVVLFLFDRVPDRVEIREPGQGIHFGIDDGDVLGLRSLGGADKPAPGEPLEEFFPQGDDTVFDLYLRARPGGQTPDVLKLRGDDGFVTGLAAAFDLPDLTPGEFALQLVNAPVLQELRDLSSSDTGGSL